MSKNKDPAAENKSPAVLFYTADFLVGVQGLTMEERGQYITLLCLQHQNGHLSEKDIKLAVGSASDDVMAKFSVDDCGLYYQHRMDEESAKRCNYVLTRQQNGQKGGRPSKAKKNHMVNHTETIEKPYGKPYENHMGNENVNNTVAIINTTGNVYNFSKTTTTTKKYVDMGAREREELEIHIVENFSENGYKSDPYSFIAYHASRGFVDECGKNILEDLPRYIKQWEAMCTATDSSVSLGVKTKRYADMSEDEKIALEMRIEEIFAKTGCKSDPYDFIAYNKPRGFIGIGGENILEELPKYIDRWERREYERIGREAPERLL